MDDAQKAERAEHATPISAYPYFGIQCSLHARSSDQISPMYIIGSLCLFSTRLPVLPKNRGPEVSRKISFYPGNRNSGDISKLRVRLRCYLENYLTWAYTSTSGCHSPSLRIIIQVRWHSKQFRRKRLRIYRSGSRDGFVADRPIF